MMTVRKFLAAVLALLLVCLPALAGKEIPDGQDVVVVTRALDYTGKTVILHTNDVHGRLEGYACVAQLAKDLRAKGAEVIVADAGDFAQGTIYVTLNKGHAAIEMMNAAGYDVATLGNHEFDFGVDTLLENLKDAKFRVICANVTLNDKHILPATTVFDTQSGLKIGFFGIETPETASKVNPGMIQGVRFSTFDDLYAAGQSAVDALRAEGVDLVIGLLHLGIDDESAVNGYRSSDFLSHVSGVDLAIDGHSHTVMTEGEGGEEIQSTGAYFAFIGAVVIDNATKTIEDHYLMDPRYLPSDPDVEAAAKAIMNDIDDKYAASFATSEVVLNGNRDPGNRTEETNLGDLLADAVVWSVTHVDGVLKDDTAGVIGIVNGGSIRAPIDEGPVTMKEVNTVQPFGNTVAVIYATGHEVLEALEASTFATPSAIGGFPQTHGIDWTIDTTVAYDQGDLYRNADGGETCYYAPASIKRVSIQSVGDKPFDPDATYAVITNNFCAAGGDTYNVFMRAYNAGTGFDTGIPTDEALVDYITNALGGKITRAAYGKPRGSITIIRPSEGT